MVAGEGRRAQMHLYFYYRTVSFLLTLVKLCTEQKLYPHEVVFLFNTLPSQRSTPWRIFAMMKIMSHTKAIMVDSCPEEIWKCCLIPTTRLYVKQFRKVLRDFAVQYKHKRRVECQPSIFTFYNRFCMSELCRFLWHLVYRSRMFVDCQIYGFIFIFGHVRER